MYASDFGFAAAPSAWTTILNNYASYTSINWMYLGTYEWMISRGTDYSNSVFCVYSDGFVHLSIVNSYTYAVRPSFYLNSVTYASGTGTSANPIRVN